MITTLELISQQIDPQFRSDKGPHYLAFYDDIFSSLRNKTLNFLEVGIFQGGGLLLFGQYLEKGRILGVDISAPPQVFHDELIRLGLNERVSIAIGSQDNETFLTESISSYFGNEMLDIVIDDASHFYKQTKTTFDHVFHKHLKSGGWYIIEDWSCGYWPEWNDGNPDGQHGLPKLIKEIVDEVALADRTRLYKGKRALPVEDVQYSLIRRMIVLPSIVAVNKI